MPDIYCLLGDVFHYVAQARIVDVLHILPIAFNQLKCIVLGITFAAAVGLLLTTVAAVNRVATLLIVTFFRIGTCITLEWPLAVLAGSPV